MDGTCSSAGVRQAIRVFIIDDSGLVRDRLTAMLSEHPGMDIIGEAEDAFSAIECIQLYTPDVVILDIHMAGSASGIYVLERIKKGSNAPIVIMLTNYSNFQYRKRCKKAGAEYFFDKSSEFERVTEVLEAMVSTDVESFAE